MSRTRGGRRRKAREGAENGAGRGEAEGKSRETGNADVEKGERERYGDGSRQAAFQPGTRGDGTGGGSDGV